MLIKVQKDSATVVSKEVASLEEAKGVQSNGFHVEVMQEDGTYVPLADLIAADEPDTADEARAGAELAAFTKSGKTEAQWKKLSKAAREDLIAAEMV